MKEITDTERLDWLWVIVHPDDQHTDEGRARFAALRHEFSQGETEREMIDAAMQALAPPAAKTAIEKTKE